MTKITKADVKPHFGQCTDIDEDTFRTKCPVHNGASESLIIFIKEGKWVNGYCHNNECDQESVQSYINDLGFNQPTTPKMGGFKKTTTKPQKNTPTIKKIMKVMPKHKEKWQEMFTDLQKEGHVLGKTFWVYWDIAAKYRCCVMTRINKPDGSKEFYPRMLAHSSDTNQVHIINKGPDAPKPLYVANRHKIEKEKIDTLHIYEGEKAAEAGSHLFQDADNIVHLTWMGGSKGQKKADWKSLDHFKFKEVVLFPDNDVAGKDAMKEIAQILANYGHNTINTVDVESFPVKWDVADIKNDSEFQKLLELYRSPTKFEAVTPLEHAYVNDQDLFYNLNRGIMYGSAHFGRVLRGNPYTPPAAGLEDAEIDSTNKFLDNKLTMKVDRLEFDPSQPKLFKDNGASCLNSYIPYYIRPIEGDVQPFLDLLKIWIPDDTDRGNGEYYRHWATCWWSHNIQHPGKKILSAPVWISEEGYGKGTVFKLFQAMLGREYVAEVTQTQIESNFNNFVFRKLMIFFDELRVDQSSRVNIMNKLKFYITEPMVAYNDKYKLERDIPNTFNISCHSNHRNAITLKGDSRRWFCHYIEQKPKEELFDKLIAMQRNAPGVLLKYLKEYDISDWKPHKEPPKTDFFYEICEATDNMAHKWLENRYRSDMPPFHPESTLVVIEDLAEVAAQIPGSKGVNETSILSWLHIKHAKPLGQMRIHGMRKSFWDMRPDRIRPETTAELVREYIMPLVSYDGSKKVVCHLNYEQQAGHFSRIRNDAEPERDFC